MNQRRTTETCSATDAAVRVTIVEDDHVIRQRLTALIDGTQGFRTAGAYVSMEQAIPEIDADPPDILLLDIGLPGISGIEGSASSRRATPIFRCWCCRCTAMTIVSSRLCVPGRAATC